MVRGTSALERELPSRKTTNSKKAQSRRFIEAAREAGASEDEAVFRENLKGVATAKEKPRPRDDN
jgi:hypothetical protein